MVADFFEDQIGGGGPHKGLGLAVVCSDVIGDGLFEIVDAVKGAAAQPLLRDFGKPTFDLVEPGGARRREVQVIARPAAQPVRYLRGFVGPVVVQYQMHFQVGRHLALDLPQKRQELLVPMAGVAAPDHLAAGDVQRGKERGGAVPIVIMGLPLGLTRSQRQNRLAAIQRLDLTFFVHAQDDRTGRLGRVEVEADDVAHLFHKERIARKFEVLLQMRLEPVGVPDAHDGVLRQPAGLGHRARAPVRAVGRSLLQGARNHFLDLGIGNPARLPRPRRIGEAVQTVRQEASPPFAHRGQRDGPLFGHRRVRPTLRAVQHDGGAQRRALIRLGSAHHQLQLRSFFLAQNDFLGRAFQAHPFRIAVAQNHVTD